MSYFLVNPWGLSDQLIGRFIFDKMGERKKIKIQVFFDAKLRFALLASLRSAIFSKNESTN